MLTTQSSPIVTSSTLKFVYFAQADGQSDFVASENLTDEDDVANALQWLDYLAAPDSILQPTSEIVPAPPEKSDGN
jgi:hypothetical protein